MIAARNLGKSFEGTAALKAVSFEAANGAVLAICGENGAGKSTLMKILSGAIRPDDGEIVLDGRAVEIADPRHAIDLGIATVHQELSLLPHLSVAENIMLGKTPHRRAAWLVDWPAMRERAARILADLGFDDIDVNVRVAELSVSVQQIVEIAKALVGNPGVLILDEPTAVLSARETEILFAKVRQLTAGGTVVLYISHRLEEIFEIADAVLVLKDGVKVLDCAIAMLNRDKLVRAMVGRSLAAIYPEHRATVGAAALECRDLGRAGKFRHVDLCVRAGEIVGMFGLVGSGRTDVARAIFGAAPAAAGEIRLSGKPVAIASPADAVTHGIAFVTEDRKRDGLALDLSVLDNASLATMGRVSRYGIIDRTRREQMVTAKIEQLAVRPRDVNRPVRQLSGGNQQKVVLAKWLLLEKVRIVIFDEPTRGVDIATKVDIYRMIADLAESGRAILLISSEMPELLGMSDRVIVMRKGAIAAVLERAEFDMERIFAYAAGLNDDRPTAVTPQHEERPL